MRRCCQVPLTNGSDGQTHPTPAVAPLTAPRPRRRHSERSGAGNRVRRGRAGGKLHRPGERKGAGVLGRRSAGLSAYFTATTFTASVRVTGIHFLSSVLAPEALAARM